MTTPTLSPQQQAVVDWVVDGRGSLNLIARAGCGKTYTLLRGAVRAIVEHNRGEVAVMAFNKAIADEFKVKLQELATETGDRRFVDWKRVDTGTVHSFGFRTWRREMTTPREQQVDEKKVIKLIDGRAEDLQRRGAERNIWRDCGPALRKAVSLAKQAAFGVLCGLEDRGRWYELLEHHGVNELADGYELDELVPAAIELLKVSISLDREVVDFDDMIFAPLYHKVRFWPKDWVLIDEAQDTNPARRALALAMLKPRTGRLIAVGDDRQAIYGFTGADADALELIKAELNSAELPLNVTYRCPRAVVAEANRLVPDLTAHESAPEGIVRTSATVHHSCKECGSNDLTGSSCTNDCRPEYLEHYQWFQVEPPAATSVILCRNTKPIIEQAYAMLRHGVGCRVEGREIGEGLLTLARRWKRIRSLAQLVDKLEDYQSRETQRWLAKGKEDRAQQIEDKCETVRVICLQLLADGKSKLADLEAFVHNLFGDTKPGERPNVVTLSTIHKAKGREWDCVYLLDRSGTLPSKWARKPWQLRQEENLEYVAITRSKHELVYLEVV